MRYGNSLTLLDSNSRIFSITNPSVLVSSDFLFRVSSVVDYLIVICICIIIRVFSFILLLGLYKPSEIITSSAISDLISPLSFFFDLFILIVMETLLIRLFLFLWLLCYSVTLLLCSSVVRILISLPCVDEVIFSFIANVLDFWSTLVLLVFFHFLI